MHLRRALAVVGAVTAATVAACRDVPFAPHWDADMYLPLSTRAIYLSNTFTTGFVPPSTSDTVSFPPQRQDVTGAIGDVLKNMVTDPARARTVLTLTVSKTTQVSANDTLFVARDSASLHPSGADSTVAFPLTLASSDLSKTDSLSLTVAQITMMQNAAKATAGTAHPLWIQLRGRVSNPSGNAITITTADSINIRLTVTARITVSH